MKSKILNKRTKIAGIVSALFLIASVILILADFISYAGTGQEVSTFGVGVVCSVLAFIIGLAGIIKAQNSETGKMLCWCGIVCPSLFAFFVLSIFIIYKSMETYTDEYLYDKSRNKIYYEMTEGYFEYNRKDIFMWLSSPGAGGKFYYTVYMSGPHGERLPLPYCYFLASRDENELSMIGLKGFCDYHGIEIEQDKTAEKTILTYHANKIVLPWGKYQAHYEKTKEVIDLKYPVIYKNIEEDTFVDIDFLYYAAFLKLYDEKSCDDFIEYLKVVDKVIYEKGEEKDGSYYYKENLKAGACTYFYNNELFEDSKIKIGMSRDEVISILGEPVDPKNKECMDYPCLWMNLDENQKVREVEIDWEGYYYFYEKEKENASI